MPTTPESPSDLLTVKELAEYLRLNERTVLKLAAQGALPGARLGNQWRFRRAVLDAWLDDQMLGVRPSARGELLDRPATFSFDEGFGPEHVLLSLRGRTVPTVLQELAAHAQALGLVRDRTWFLGALIERENLLTSAVGHGVAFPHTLARHPEQVVRPFLLLGRSADGVDFRAPDRGLVHIVLLMGLRFAELHLPWLERLSTVLEDDRTRAEVLGANDEEGVCAALRTFVRGSEAG